MRMPALTKRLGVTGVVLPAGASASKQPREAIWEFEIVLRWTTVQMRGPGYCNLGNTCFMNSVIQALVHTPPFAELILGDRGKQLLEELLVLSRLGQDDDGGCAGSRVGDNDSGDAGHGGSGRGDDDGGDDEEGSDGDVVLIDEGGCRDGCRRGSIFGDRNDDDQDDDEDNDEVVLVHDDDDGGRGGSGGCRRGRTEDKPAVVLALELMRRATSKTPLSPDDLVKSLPQLNKQFKRGRQEDSHEFLRCLLDALHETCLKRFGPKPPPELVESTFVFRIFGGKLRHQVTQAVRKEGAKDGSSNNSSSNPDKFEPFLDLSLGITQAQSVEEALGDLTAVVALDGDNMYRCAVDGGEGTLVRAERRASVEDPPVVLTLHLMRFNVDEDGNLVKIASAVGFGAWLDLRPFMSDTSGAPVMYELYAVIVHIGRSAIRGHYVCYAKAGDGRWYLCNDSVVTQVEERDVLRQQAYILFYIRRPPGDAAAAAAAAAAQQTAAAAAAAIQQTRCTPPLHAVAEGKDCTADTTKGGCTAGNGRDRVQDPAPAQAPTSTPTCASPAPVVRARASAATQSPANVPAPVCRAPAPAAAVSRQRKEDASAGGALIPAPADRAKRQRQAPAALGAAAPAASGLAVQRRGGGAAAGGRPAAAVAVGGRELNTMNALAHMLSNLSGSRQLQVPKLKGSQAAAAPASRQQDAEAQQAPRRPQRPQQAPQQPRQLQHPQGAHEPRRRQAHGGAAAHEGPAADGRDCVRQRVFEQAESSGHALGNGGEAAACRTAAVAQASPAAATADASASASASAQQATSGGSRELVPGGKSVRTLRPRGRCVEVGLPPQLQSPQSERSGASVEAVVGLPPPQQPGLPPPQQPQQRQEQQGTQSGDRGPSGGRGQQREPAAAEVLPVRKRGRFAGMLSECMSEALREVGPADGDASSSQRRGRRKEG